MSRTKHRTASASKKPIPPADRRSRADRRGLHIYHNDGRFEERTPSRHFFGKSLYYTRDFVGDGGCDEGADYQNQFSLLACNGEGLDYCQMYGCYRLLVNLAARHARRHRGWLLGPDKEPLSDSQIGHLLHIPPKQMTKMLKRFIAVRLLEKIELPDFDSMTDEAPEDDAGASDDNDERNATATSKDGQSRPQAHLRRTRARGCAQVRAPLINDKRQNGKGKWKDNQRPTAAGKKKKNNGKAEVKVQVESQGEAEGQAQAQAQRQSAEPCPPTTPPSAAQPHESDAGGDRVTPTPSPLPSLSQGQSRHGLSYGRRVYLGLGYRHDVDSVEARRETTSFASKYDQIVSALSALSPPAVDALLQRGLAEAVKIGKRKGNRNKGAVWHTVMDKFAAAAHQRSPPQRAAM